MNRSVALPIISTSIGVFAAIQALPNDVMPPGAIRNSAILFIIGLLLPAATALVQRGIEEILNTEWMVIVAIVYFVLLDMVQGLYPLDVTKDAVRDVFLALGLFVVALWIGVAQRPIRLPGIVIRSASVDLTSQFLLKLAWLCFILGIFYFAFMSGFSPVRMLVGLQGSRWAAPWSRGSIGNWYSFIEQMQYFGYLLPTVTMMIAIREGRLFSRRTLQGVMLSLVFLPFLLQGGGRRIFGMLVGGAVFTWLCSARQRLRFRHGVILLVTVAVCLVVMDEMLATRNKGVLEYSYSVDEFHSVRVDDNFLRFAQIMDLVPSQFPHVGFKWVVYVLARPVPRVFWPNKPLDMGFDLSAAEGVTASLSASCVSEWYVAFGWLGVAFGGFAYGRITRWWDQILTNFQTVSSISIYSVGLMTLVISVRSTIELILMSYPLISLLILLHFVKQRPTAELQSAAPFLERSAESLP